MAILDPIPTREEFELSGGRPEQFEVFLKAEQDKLAAKALAAATDKAGAAVKLRVRGPAGRQGQSSYMLPAKAPFIKGVAQLPAEPGIRIPLGRVVLVPVRDEAHLDCLKMDENLEILGDDVPTFEEEEAAKQEGLEAMKAKRAGKK
jgi:hypothetical protein